MATDGAAVSKAGGDALAKARATWALGNFGDIANVGTVTAAPALVRAAGVRAGMSVLDVGTGTGTVALTARRLGAKVTGLDLTPELLAQAKENARLAGYDDVAWREGDAAALPFPDGSFDVVLSQYGHMFAPDLEGAGRELVRVAKGGGTIAVSTWPPNTLVGRLFALNAKYVPPPAGTRSAMEWGEPAKVAAFLGSGVRDVRFSYHPMQFPALSGAHFRVMFEAKYGPTLRTVQALAADPAKLAAWRAEYEAIVDAHLDDNVVRHDYLLTRARKA